MKGELRGVKTLLFLGPLKTPYSLLLLQGIQRHTSSENVSEDEAGCYKKQKEKTKCTFLTLHIQIDF